MCLHLTKPDKNTCASRALPIGFQWLWWAGLFQKKGALANIRLPWIGETINWYNENNGVSKSVLAGFWCGHCFLVPREGPCCGLWLRDTWKAVRDCRLPHLTCINAPDPIHDPTCWLLHLCKEKKPEKLPSSCIVDKAPGTTSAPWQQAENSDEAWTEAETRLLQVMWSDSGCRQIC